MEFIRRFRTLFLSSLLCAIGASAQVPVQLGPVPKAQFFSNTAPLASGYVCTFASGTNTPQATYTDSTGLVQNSNPTVLDAGGYANIWFTAQSYKVVVRNPGGDSTCGAGGGQIQYSVDNFLVSPFLSGNNTWTGTQIFSAGVTFNGAAAFNAGGSMSGTFTGSPVFSGAVSFSGNPTFSGAPNFASANPVFSGKIIPTLNAPIQSIILGNAAGGTVVNTLTKLTGAPSAAIQTTTADTVGAIGICTLGCGTTGSATIQNVGMGICALDAGGATAGDYVIISSTTAGDCHDVAGGGYPSSGQVIGRSLSTQAGFSLLFVDLFGAEDRSNTATAVFPSIAYNTPSASTNANIVATTMTTVGASNATYRFSWYLQESVVGIGCTGNTTLAPSLIWQDPLDAAGGAVPFFSAIIANGGNGTLGKIFNTLAAQASSSYEFRAKAGTVIQYSTTYTLGATCGPGPQYVIFPVLEQLTSN